jgi:hypothetical protein
MPGGNPPFMPTASSGTLLLTSGACISLSGGTTSLPTYYQLSVLEDQGLALQRSLYARRQNLLGRRFDKLRCRANGIAGLHVEEHGDARELIDVVHGLRADNGVRAGHRVQRKMPGIMTRY